MCKNNFGKRVCKYLKRLKQNDDCFDEFYYTVYYCVEGIVYENLFDRSYVDDAVMNTFCRIKDNIDKYDGSDRGYSWVCKIAQNEARRINAELSPYTLSLDDIPQAGERYTYTPDRETVCAAVDAVSKLEKPLKQIVIYRIYYDMTFKEIAERLGMCLTTVYDGFNRALKILRTFLTDC